MGKFLKIVLPLVMAVIVAGGYYVYALPKTDGGYVLVARTSIQPGQEITKEMLRVVKVSSEEPIQSIHLDKVVGKKAKELIQAGEVVLPQRLAANEDENERLYTMTLDYTQANGPMIRPGMTVEVWRSATKTDASEKITTAQIYQIKSKKDVLEVGEKVSVVLRANEPKIQAIETARGDAELFLVVPASEVH